MLLKNNMTVLFQGDSITDCGRTSVQFGNGNLWGNENLGLGFPNMFSSFMSAKYKNINVTYFNRGISGNRSCDLVGRWQQDCLDINPDIMVMLIGINDVWRKFDKNDPTSNEDFSKNYRFLLEETIKKNPDVKFVLIEPFFFNVPCQHTDDFRAELLGKIREIRLLCKEFGCYYVPFDGIVAGACMTGEYTKWLFPDGVHLSSNGHALLCSELVKIFEEN